MDLEFCVTSRLELISRIKRDCFHMMRTIWLLVDVHEDSPWPGMRLSFLVESQLRCSLTLYHGRRKLLLAELFRSLS